MAKGTTPKPPSSGKSNAPSKKPDVNAKVDTSASTNSDEKKSYLNQLKEETSKSFKKGFYESFGLSPPDEKSEIDKIKEKVGETAESKKNDDLNRVLKEKGNATKIYRKIDALGIYARRNYQEIIDIKRRVSGIENSLTNLKKSNNVNLQEPSKKGDKLQPTAPKGGGSSSNILDAVIGEALVEAVKKVAPRILPYLANPITGGMAAAGATATAAIFGSAALGDWVESKFGTKEKIKARESTDEYKELQKTQQQSSDRTRRASGLSAPQGPLTNEEKKQWQSLPSEIKKQFKNNPTEWKAAGKPTSISSGTDRTWMDTAEELLQRDRNWDSFQYTKYDLSAAAQELTDKKVQTTSQLSVDQNRLESLARKIAQERKTSGNVSPSASPSGTPSSAMSSGGGGGGTPSVSRGGGGMPSVDTMGSVTGMPSAPPSAARSSTPSAAAPSVTPSAGGGGGTPPTKGELKGGTFKDQSPVVMNRLMKDFNLTREQAAGVVGNLGHESAGMKAGIQEKGVTVGRGGLGWAQWTGPRRRSFESFLKDNNMSATDPEANYAFLKKELETTHKSSLNALRKTTDPQQAMMVFEKHYEAAGVKHYDSRAKYTMEALRHHSDYQAAQPTVAAGGEGATPMATPSPVTPKGPPAPPTPAGPASPSTPAAGLSSSGITGKAGAAMPSLKRDLAPISQERSVGGYEAMYQQIGTFRGQGRYGNLNISAGERAAGRYGGLCGVGVSNAIGVMFGDSRFKSVSGMHAGSFSMAGNNRTLNDSGLYQGKQALSDKDFNALKSNPKSLPPGTIVAVGSTSGRQHIQMWDGKNWISDTVQKGLLNMRAGEQGTGAIYYPTPEGLARLPKEVRAKAEANGFKFGDIPPSDRSTSDNQAAVQQGATAPVGEGAKPIDKQPPIEKSELLKQVRAGLPPNATPAQVAARDKLMESEERLRKTDPSNPLLPENEGKVATASAEAASGAIQTAEQVFAQDAAKANVGQSGPGFDSMGGDGVVAPVDESAGPSLREKISDARAGLDDTTSQGFIPDAELSANRQLTQSVDSEGRASSEFSQYAGNKKSVLGSTMLGSLLTREGGVSEQFLGSKTKMSDAEGASSDEILGRRVSGGLLGFDKRELYGPGGEKLDVSSGEYAQVQKLIESGRMDEAKFAMAAIKANQENPMQPTYDAMGNVTGQEPINKDSATPAGMDMAAVTAQGLGGLAGAQNENYDTGAGGFADTPEAAPAPAAPARELTAYEKLAQYHAKVEASGKVAPGSTRLADGNIVSNAMDMSNYVPGKGFVVSDGTKMPETGPMQGPPAPVQGPSAPVQGPPAPMQGPMAPAATPVSTDTASSSAMGMGFGDGEDLNVTPDSEKKIQQQYNIGRDTADSDAGYTGQAGEMIQTEVEKVRLDEQKADVKSKESDVISAREGVVSAATSGGGGTESKPHNPESSAPTPGNDGYGSQKNSSDMPSICTV